MSLLLSVFLGALRPPRVPQPSSPNTHSESEHTTTYNQPSASGRGLHFHHKGNDEVTTLAEETTVFWPTLRVSDTSRDATSLLLAQPTLELVAQSVYETAASLQRESNTTKNIKGRASVHSPAGLGSPQGGFANHRDAPRSYSEQQVYDRAQKLLRTLYSSLRPATILAMSGHFSSLSLDAQQTAADTQHIYQFWNMAISQLQENGLLSLAAARSRTSFMNELRVAIRRKAALERRQRRARRRPQRSQVAATSKVTTSSKATTNNEETTTDNKPQRKYSDGSNRSSATFASTFLVSTDQTPPADVYSRRSSNDTDMMDIDHDNNNNNNNNNLNEQSMQFEDAESSPQKMARKYSNSSTEGRRVETGSMGSHLDSNSDFDSEEEEEDSDDGELDVEVENELLDELFREKIKSEEAPSIEGEFFCVNSSELSTLIQQSIPMSPGRPLAIAGMLDIFVKKRILVKELDLAVFAKMIVEISTHEARVLGWKKLPISEAKKYIIANNLNSVFDLTVARSSNNGNKSLMTSLTKYISTTISGLTTVFNVLFGYPISPDEEYYHMESSSGGTRGEGSESAASANDSMEQTNLIFIQQLDDVAAVISRTIAYEFVYPVDCVIPAEKFRMRLFHAFERIMAGTDTHKNKKPQFQVKLSVHDIELIELTMFASGRARIATDPRDSKNVVVKFSLVGSGHREGVSESSTSKKGVIAGETIAQKWEDFLSKQIGTKGKKSKAQQRSLNSSKRTPEDEDIQIKVYDFQFVKVVRSVTKVEKMIEDLQDKSEYYKAEAQRFLVKSQQVKAAAEKTASATGKSGKELVQSLRSTSEEKELRERARLCLTRSLNIKKDIKKLVTVHDTLTTIEDQVRRLTGDVEIHDAMQAGSRAIQGVMSSFVSKEEALQGKTAKEVASETIEEAIDMIEESVTLHNEINGNMSSGLKLGTEEEERLLQLELDALVAEDSLPGVVPTGVGSAPGSHTRSDPERTQGLLAQAPKAPANVPTKEASNVPPAASDGVAARLAELAI